MSSRTKSRFVLLVDNVASQTRSKDIKYECERWGPVLAVERDARYRCALVEFKRNLVHCPPCGCSARDAEEAWDRLDNILIDGKRWKVDYARREDFKFFGWQWTEGGYDSPRRGRSRSRSKGRSPSRSPSGF